MVYGALGSLLGFQALYRTSLGVGVGSVPLCLQQPFGKDPLSQSLYLQETIPVNLELGYH